MQPGHIEGQIGSCRIITLDGQSFVEQLEGLDDIRHILRYKVISHPNAVNPFPFAFLNFQAKVQLRNVTLTNETFMEYDGNFDTEWPVRAAHLRGSRDCCSPGVAHACSRPCLRIIAHEAAGCIMCVLQIFAVSRASYTA